MEEENEFEVRRQQNIAKNEEFLKNLGLDSLRSSIEASRPAAAKPTARGDDSKGKARRKVCATPSSAPRRSLRSAGPAPASTAADDEDGAVHIQVRGYA